MSYSHYFVSAVFHIYIPVLEKNIRTYIYRMKQISKQKYRMFCYIKSKKCILSYLYTYTYSRVVIRKYYHQILHCSYAVVHLLKKVSGFNPKEENNISFSLLFTLNIDQFGADSSKSRAFANSQI